jgi:hypothetical protein
MDRLSSSLQMLHWSQKVPELVVNYVYSAKEKWKENFKRNMHHQSDWN